jgi:two-component system sensor histidine kinase MprB
LPFDEDDIGYAISTSDDIDDFHLHTVSVGGVTYRTITVPWTDTSGVQAARSLEEIDEVLAGIRLRLVLAGLAATLGALVVGIFLADRIARPIRRLSSVATTIAETRDLTQPVPTAGAGEVGDLGRAFASMTSALATSLEQQKRLINDASHEMRTPLTALRTNVESLEMFDTITPEERREMLRDIRHEVEELANLTAELVDLATDRGVVDEPVSEVDLYDVAVEVARRAERRSGRRITVTDNGRNPVEARFAQIQRAVSNLVDNAIKYSPEGSSVEIEVDGGRLRVRDHGAGIADEDRPHVFERFYRAIGARSAPGSGLGLSIVAQIVEMHGGTVSVDNAPDGGAIVGFDLPD